MAEDFTRQDPSALTIDTIALSVAALKELVETRLDGMDIAIKVAHDDLVRVPTDVQQQVGNLKELHENRFTAQAQLRDEKFASVQRQFEERDTRVEQTARDTKTAVDAALAAQEKAFGKQSETFSASTSKTEESFTKQIEQLGTLLQTNTKSLEDKISDLKDRFNRGEGRGEGAVSSVAARHASSGNILGIIGGVVGIVGLAVGIILAIAK